MSFPCPSTLGEKAKPAGYRFPAYFALFSVVAFAASPNERPPIRVCADPNNMPFSNRQAQGFENKLAELLAAKLGARLEYTWWAERKSFIVNSLEQGRCDLVMGVPALHIEALPGTSSVSASSANMARKIRRAK
jgi:mxaJ protein